MEEVRYVRTQAHYIFGNGCCGPYKCPTMELFQTWMYRVIPFTVNIL